jgi:DNA-binding PadR family transcriptional regulator
VAYQLPPLGLAVLALLRERPMHGYEMFQTLIARREDRIVKVRPGSLYHVVYRLAEEKLIRQTSTGRAGNRPERTIFEITDLGFEALTDRVRDLVATPADEFPPFVVALAEIHNLDRDAAGEAVRDRITAREADLGELAAQRDASTASAIQLTALDYLLATTKAEVGWLRVADAVESGRLGWQHAGEPDTIGGHRSEVAI